MIHSIQATFEADYSAGTPVKIGFRGLLAANPGGDIRAVKGSAFDPLGIFTAPAVARTKDRPKKIYPVESYYLNGAQYLTGGVGNQLSFL